MNVSIEAKFMQKVCPKRIIFPFERDLLSGFYKKLSWYCQWVSTKCTPVFCLLSFFFPGTYLFWEWDLCGSSLTFLFPMPSNFILLQVFLQGPCLSGLWEVWGGGCHERGMLGSQWAHCSMARAGGRDEVWRLEQTHWLLLPGLMRRWWCLRGQWIQEPCFLASSTMRGPLSAHLPLDLNDCSQPRGISHRNVLFNHSGGRKATRCQQAVSGPHAQDSLCSRPFPASGRPLVYSSKIKILMWPFHFFPIHTGQPFSK